MWGVADINFINFADFFLIYEREISLTRILRTKGCWNGEFLSLKGPVRLTIVTIFSFLLQIFTVLKRRSTHYSMTAGFHLLQVRMESELTLLLGSSGLPVSWLGVCGNITCAYLVDKDLLYCRIEAMALSCLMAWNLGVCYKTMRNSTVYSRLTPTLQENTPRKFGFYRKFYSVHIFLRLETDLQSQ